MEAIGPHAPNWTEQTFQTSWRLGNWTELNWCQTILNYEREELASSRTLRALVMRSKMSNWKFWVWVIWYVFWSVYQPPVIFSRPLLETLHAYTLDLHIHLFSFNNIWKFANVLSVLFKNKIFNWLVPHCPKLSQFQKSNIQLIDTFMIYLLMKTNLFFTELWRTDLGLASLFWSVGVKMMIRKALKIWRSIRSFGRYHEKKMRGGSVPLVSCILTFTIIRNSTGF